jgi:hypothetical protein
MTIVVSLQDVINEMDVMSDEIHAYLNKVTGELVTITDEEINAIENGDEWSEYPEWQHALLDTAQQVLGSDDYLPLPSRFDIHEYAIMERFCYSIEDDALSDELAHRIRGSGAFRQFKDAIYEHGIEEDWYRFRAQALEEIAIDWLEGQGIAYVKTDDSE